VQAEIPQRITVREPEVTVFEDRPIPDILWYSKKLRYSIATQDRAAPLIFLIAGMGAGHNDPKTQFLQRVFSSRIPRCLSSLRIPSELHSRCIGQRHSRFPPGRRPRPLPDHGANHP
jgi:hypothetical protein